MSERTPEYLGPFAVHLRSFIEEKRLLGCRYMEEERLAHKFDHMSMEYDSSGGLSPELVNACLLYTSFLMDRLDQRIGISVLL